MKKLIGEIARFGIVGVIATLIDWGVFWVIRNWVGADEILSSAIGFSVSVVFNYIASRIWVFHVKSKQNATREFVWFLISALVGLGINTLVFWLCNDWLFGNIDFLNFMPRNLLEILAKAVATMVVMAFNYPLRKFVVFKEPKNKE